jgi:putative PIN family toxin of toxin-antitoxin system
MKVILDTNVLLSALISPHGISDIIYKSWHAAKFTLITFQQQLEELRRASRYPKFKDILQPARVGTMINNLQRAVILKKLVINAEIKDPNDAYLCTRFPSCAQFNILSMNRFCRFNSVKINKQLILI